MSRKGRERRKAAAQNPAPEPTADEIENWPPYWRDRAGLRPVHRETFEDLASSSVRHSPDQRSWSWGGGTSAQFSAVIDGDVVAWVEKSPDPRSIRQTVVEFLAFGAPDGIAPPVVLRDLRDAIRFRDRDRWRILLGEAEVLRSSRPDLPHPDYRRIGKFVWEWGEDADGYTAILDRKAVIWNWHGPKDFGNSIAQPVAGFIARGPDEKNAPDGLAWEIFLAIRARDFPRWPHWLAEAREQSESGADRSAGGVSLDDAARKSSDGGLPAGPDADDAPPFGRLLVQGFAVVGFSAALALLLAMAAPTLAKYAGLILPVVLGFAAAFRWGSMALIMAGFFAMAGGFGSQIAYERYSELARGPAVTLASIAEAPRHPEATRFTVTDGREARAFSGSARRSVMRPSSLGPSPRIVLAHAVPLVPAGWTSAQPVPAWLACTATPGFDCSRRSGGDVKSTVRIRDAEIAIHRDAIADAQRRHGLRSAEGAPVLEVSRDPVGAPGFYLAAAIVAPLAAFGLWAMGVIGSRLWRRRTAAVSE